MREWVSPHGDRAAGVSRPHWGKKCPGPHVPRTHTIDGRGAERKAAKQSHPVVRICAGRPQSRPGRQVRRAWTRTRGGRSSPEGRGRVSAPANSWDLSGVPHAHASKDECLTAFPTIEPRLPPPGLPRAVRTDLHPQRGPWSGIGGEAASHGVPDSKGVRRGK